jgi:hypothetical protein
MRKPDGYAARAAATVVRRLFRCVEVSSNWSLPSKSMISIVLGKHLCMHPLLSRVICMLQAQWDASDAMLEEQGAALASVHASEV